MMAEGWREWVFQAEALSLSPGNLGPWLNADHEDPSASGWHFRTADNARSLVLDVVGGVRHLQFTGDLDELRLVELVTQTHLNRLT